MNSAVNKGQILSITHGSIQFNTNHYVELNCFLTCAFPTVYHTVYYFIIAFKGSKELFDFFTALQKVVLKDVPQCC